MSRETTPGDRVRIAFDLADAGITMMRENLRRLHPEAAPEEIERLLKAWLTRRPPDAPGRPRPVPGV